jgi:hypothetical protein
MLRKPRYKGNKGYFGLTVDFDALFSTKEEGQAFADSLNLPKYAKPWVTGCSSGTYGDCCAVGRFIDLRRDNRKGAINEAGLKVLKKFLATGVFAYEKDTSATAATEEEILNEVKKGE